MHQAKLHPSDSVYSSGRRKWLLRSINHLSLTVVSFKSSIRMKSMQQRMGTSSRWTCPNSFACRAGLMGWAWQEWIIGAGWETQLRNLGRPGTKPDIYWKLISLLWTWLSACFPKDRSRHMVGSLPKKCWESFAGYSARVEFIKNDLGGPVGKELDAQGSASVLSIFFFSCLHLPRLLRLGGLKVIIFWLSSVSVAAEGEEEGKRQLKAMEINSNVFPEENQFPSVGLKSFSKAKCSALRGGHCKKWFVWSSSPFPLSASRFPSREANSNSVVSGLQRVVLVNTDLEQGKIQSFHLLGFEI